MTCRLLSFAVLTLIWNSAVGEPVEIMEEGGVSVHFEKTGDEDQIKGFKQAILPEVKTILSELRADLGEKKEGDVKLFFYAPETFAKKFPNTVKKQIPAFYSSDGVHARADNDVDHALSSTLRHELTHLILDKNYKNVPAWLNEGLAEYEERKISEDPIPNNVDYNTIHIAKQDGKFLPMEKLESGGIFGRSHGTVASGLAYTTAYVAVHELKEKAGLDGIRNYLEEVSAGKNSRDAFVHYFGMTYDKFSEHLAEISKNRS